MRGKLPPFDVHSSQLRLDKSEKLLIISRNRRGFSGVNYYSSI
jgi:hypothetical protein